MPQLQQDPASTCSSDESAAILSGFTRVTAIDLINILNVVLGHTELALEDPLCLGGINSHLHAVQEAGQRMQRLLYGLQELVRGSHIPCDGTSTSLGLLLSGVIRIAQPRLNRASIIVEHSIAADLAVVIEDDVLTQVFASLVLSAIEVMPSAGGKLAITADQGAQRTATIVFDYSNGQLTEAPFAIAKTKVESNKGSWSVRGTTVTMSLPLAP